MRWAGREGRSWHERRPRMRTAGDLHARRAAPPHTVSVISSDAKTAMTTVLYAKPTTDCTLARLRPGAFVVNAARGGIIKKGAILEALRQGLLAGAGLDVVEDEPLRPVEEAATPNLIVAGHAAFCSGEAKIRMRSTPARNALAAVTGGHLENVVN